MGPFGVEFAEVDRIVHAGEAAASAVVFLKIKKNFTDNLSEINMVNFFKSFLVRGLLLYSIAIGSETCCW
jgi:hypothetical protein